MTTIKKIDKDLILEYKTDYSSNNWIKEKIDGSGYVSLKNTFRLRDEHLIGELNADAKLEDSEYTFKIGTLEKDYYLLDKKVFSTNNSFFIHKNFKIKVQHLVAHKNISIIKKIDSIVSEDIYIGGDNLKSIPEGEFIKLVKIFPNSYEISKYVDARISSILIDYIDKIQDSEKKYNNYINKKANLKSGNILKVFRDQEIYKYLSILKRLESMLNDEICYSEHQWQEQILQIILLLFPKYISAFKEVKFKDIYSNKTRRLDYVLIDYLGHLDIIEIKKPFEKSIISESKYRDNYIPRRELSGTIMQIEKYIYYLNKWGIEGEKQLTEQLKSSIPENFSIKITNPRGLIIMGRDNKLSREQLYDFEIIKRKYKNVADIFTYDDLIKRIKISISQIKKI
ncbi:Shedu immune nuclease family protein [Aureispira sp. CCB-QB1]|uniref:Shedu immune nuclease family protein n=1 Tax=Aureispira sp. CCB-QB1 TaxID=1313421 RepID=UPI000695EE7E|nr:Shedu immune nuclease family protein [Aureispira sp. CCB-QB1]